MIKLLSYLSVILGLAVFILFSLYDDAQNKITALETEKNISNCIVKVRIENHSQIIR